MLTPDKKITHPVPRATDDECKRSTGCLIDYIGIKVCGDESPESGIFINSLPGISLESMDRVASADQITFKQLWNDVQAEAEQEFFVDFASEVAKCFQLRTDCDLWEMMCANRCWLINAWKYLCGHKLMIYRLFTSRLNRFTTIDYKQAEQLRDWYMTEYKEALTVAMKLVDASACCMPCAGNPEYVTWLP